METKPLPEKSIDKVLEEVDWGKLGIEGIEDEAGPSVAVKAEPSLAAKVKPSHPAKAGPPPAAKVEPAPVTKVGLAQPAKVESPPPAGVQLIHRGSDIEIVRSWFGWQTLFVTAFTVIWDVVSFASFRGMMEGLNFLSLLIPVTGVALTYYTIARWLNRTRIVVSRAKITVRHGPLPWLGKELEASNCRQFYREEKEYRGGKGGTTQIYEVYASTRDGRSVMLVDGFTGLTSEQASFIAQQIEGYLGIERVPGEGRLFDWLH